MSKAQRLIAAIVAVITAVLLLGVLALFNLAGSWGPSGAGPGSTTSNPRHRQS